MDDWEAFGEDYDPDREWNKTEQVESRRSMDDWGALGEDDGFDREWNKTPKEQVEEQNVEEPKLNTRMKDNSSKKSSEELTGPVQHLELPKNQENPRLEPLRLEDSHGDVSVGIPERPNRLIFPPKHVPQNQILPVAVPAWSPSHGNHMLQGRQHSQFAGAPQMANMIPSPLQQPWYPYSPHPHWSPMVPHWTGRYMVPSPHLGPRPFLQHHLPYHSPQGIPPMVFPPPVATQAPRNVQDASSQTISMDSEIEKKTLEELKELITDGTREEEEVEILEEATEEKGKVLLEYRSKHEQLCAEARKFNADNLKLKNVIATRQQDLKFYLKLQGPIIPLVSASIMQQEKIRKFNNATAVYEKWREKNYAQLDIEKNYSANISFFLFNERRGIVIPQKVRKSTGGHNLHRCLKPREYFEWAKKDPVYRKEWEAAHEKIKEWQMQLEELGLVELHDSGAYRAINVRKRNLTKPKPL